MCGEELNVNTGFQIATFDLTTNTDIITGGDPGLPNMVWQFLEPNHLNYKL